MTIRYATLASPTLRAAYDEATGRMRRQSTLTPVGKPILPDKVGWLHSEMLKTLVAHGYCARPYAEHLRNLRQLRHRTRIPRRTDRPARRHPSPQSRRPESRLERRSCPPPPRRSRTHRPPPTPRPLNIRAPNTLTHPRRPDKRTPQQGNPQTHRRRRHLPRPQRSDPPRRGCARRTTRRMGRITALPRPGRPQRIPRHQRHPDRTGGHPSGADRLNQPAEESHDNVVHHVPGPDQDFGGQFVRLG
jgi:hypothetical protein